MHTHVHVYIYIYLSIPARMCTRKCMYVYLYVHISHIYVYTYVHVHICNVCMCMLGCSHAFRCLHTSIKGSMLFCILQVWVAANRFSVVVRFSRVCKSQVTLGRARQSLKVLAARTRVKQVLSSLSDHLRSQATERGPALRAGSPAFWAEILRS